MKNRIRLFAVIALVFTTRAFGASAPVPLLTPPPEIRAKAYFLMDFDSGRVLAEKNPDDQIEPASLTKVMTAYIVDLAIRDGKIKRNDPVPISEKAWRMGGSRMFAKVGSKIPADDLLKGVIVQSGNDATVALAEHVAGTEEAFTALMNQTAERLGMTKTRFTNSTGIPDPNHRSTPRDLALLSRSLIRDFPETYQWYSIKEYAYNGIKQYNRNRLLWTDTSVDGIKTGHTDSAGYCLLASAKRDGMRLISVVLGAVNDDARADETEKLLAYGFREFETHRLYTAQEPLTEAAVWKGDKKKVSLGLISDLYITIPKGQYKNLNASVDLSSRIVAPTTRGQQIGTVTVKIGDEVFAEKEVVSLETVASGGFVNNLVDDVKLWLEK